MPLTSKCPGWSSISQEASIPAGRGADLCCHFFPDMPPLPRNPSPNAALHSQDCPCSDSWLNVLQQQQCLLAKEESHTKLHRERLQMQPQPHPKNGWVHPLGCGPHTHSRPTLPLHSSASPNQPVGVCRPCAAQPACTAQGVGTAQCCPALPCTAQGVSTAHPCPALPSSVHPCPALPSTAQGVSTAQLCPELPSTAQPCPALPISAPPCLALPCTALHSLGCKNCPALPNTVLHCPALPSSAQHCPAQHSTAHPCPSFPSTAHPCPAQARWLSPARTLSQHTLPQLCPWSISIRVGWAEPDKRGLVQHMPHPLDGPYPRTTSPAPPLLPLSSDHRTSCGPGQVLIPLAGEYTPKNIIRKVTLPQGGRFGGGLGHCRNPWTDPTALSLCRTEMALRQRGWCGTSRRRSHWEGREMCRGWNVFNPRARAPGTVASSNNSPLTVLAESLQPPSMGTFIMHRPVPLRAVCLLRLSCARILV